MRTHADAAARLEAMYAARRAATTQRLLAARPTTRRPLPLADARRDAAFDAAAAAWDADPTALADALALAIATPADAR